MTNDEFPVSQMTKDKGQLTTISCDIRPARGSVLQ
jgi:hypothetical protein